MRLELTTSAVTGRRSNQLSHWAIYLILFSTIIPFGIVDPRGLEPRTVRL